MDSSIEPQYRGATLLCHSIATIIDNQMKTLEVMVQKEGITTVQMKVKTRARLDKLGDIHKETYDDIINRIIDYYEKHEKKK